MTNRSPFIIGDIAIVPNDGIDRKTGKPVIIVQVYNRKDGAMEIAVFHTPEEYDEFVEGCCMNSSRMATPSVPIRSER